MRRLTSTLTPWVIVLALFFSPTIPAALAIFGLGMTPPSV